MDNIPSNTNNRRLERTMENIYSYPFQPNGRRQELIGMATMRMITMMMYIYHYTSKKEKETIGGGGE